MCRFGTCSSWRALRRLTLSTEITTKMFIRARESVVSKLRGQTMTEYALILAAIAVVVYGAYAAMGNNIGSLANGSIPL